MGTMLLPVIVFPSVIHTHGTGLCLGLLSPGVWEACPLLVPPGGPHSPSQFNGESPGSLCFLAQPCLLVGATEPWVPSLGCLLLTSVHHTGLGSEGCLQGSHTCGRLALLLFTDGPPLS